MACKGVEKPLTLECATKCACPVLCAFPLAISIAFVQGLGCRAVQVPPYGPVSFSFVEIPLVDAQISPLRNLSVSNWEGRDSRLVVCLRAARSVALEDEGPGCHHLSPLRHGGYCGSCRRIRRREDGVLLRGGRQMKVQGDSF